MSGNRSTDSSNSTVEISVVIPLYNEEESIPELYSQLTSALQSVNNSFELIFINDGSTDRSWQKLLELQNSDCRIKCIQFRTNFGKSAALDAGFRLAQGKLIFTMDADLQDDPAEIPRFLEKMTDDVDMVNGWKKVRHDPIHKTFPSKVFNLLVNRMFGMNLNDHNCGFKLYRRQITKEIHLYGEFHRFTPVLANSRGFKVVEMDVQHRARQFGYSKYNWRRFGRGIVDLLVVKGMTVYQSRPQHLLGGVGIFFLLIGMLGIGYLTLLWILHQTGIYQTGPIGDRPLLIYSAIVLLFGGQLVSLGILAGMMNATRNDSEPFDTKDSYSTPYYSIAEIVESKDSSTNPDQ